MAIKLFAGTANPALADGVSRCLNIPLGRASIGRFSDGEVMVEIEESVRGHDIFIVQPTCAPCNDALMELMLIADAVRRASAASITAVVPYFGYARQDRRVRSSRVPITAKVVADMLSAVGVARTIVVDLHADQIQGFFPHPVENIYASGIMLADMFDRGLADASVVSPDVGGVVRARAVAKRLSDADLVIIDKRRFKQQTEVMHVIGEAKDKNCIIVDDIVDTAGTLCQAAEALMNKGALSVVAYCTHPVLSGPALERIESSKLKELVVTNTIPLSPSAEKCAKIRVLDMSPVVAETIARVSDKESVSAMFIEDKEE